MIVASARAIGAGSLDAALLCALLAALVAPRRARAGRALLVASAVALALSTAALAFAFARSDFTLAYVADNSRRSSSVAYRIAGLWAGMDGSLLLWNAMLAAVCAISGRAVPVAGALVAASVAVSRAAADPFVRLDLPAINGAGITPILEHPAMLYHPLILYAGLVATALPLLSTAAALWHRGAALDARWAREVRRGLLITVAVLTAGLLAGANWSYAELGWGGFWAWDPIENGALLPWLASIAALHVLRSAPRRYDLAAYASIVPFPLTMLGVVLTRSGVTVSVHSFAEARTVGWCLLAIAGAVAAASGYLAYRARPRVAERPAWRWFAPAGAPAWALAPTLAVLAAVLVGTVAPVIGRLTGGDGTATAGRYYAWATAPMATAALVLMLIFPGRASRASSAPLAAGAAAAGVALIAALSAGVRSFAPLLLGPLAAAVAASSLTLVVMSRAASRRAAHVAHLGFALLLIGVAGSAAAETITGPLARGDAVRVGDYTFVNRGVAVAEGPHADTSAVVATIEVRRGSRVVATLEPSVVAYPNLGVLLAESDLERLAARDLQIVLRTADDSGIAVVDIGVRPLTRLVWLGSALMVVGFSGALLAGARSRRIAAALPVE